MLQVGWLELLGLGQGRSFRFPSGTELGRFVDLLLLPVIVEHDEATLVDLRVAEEAFNSSGVSVGYLPISPGVRNRIECGGQKVQFHFFTGPPSPVTASPRFHFFTGPPSPVTASPRFHFFTGPPSPELR
jgi:hypothetical protein